MYVNETMITIQQINKDDFWQLRMGARGASSHSSPRGGNFELGEALSFIHLPSPRTDRWIAAPRETALTLEAGLRLRLLYALTLRQVHREFIDSERAAQPHRDNLFPSPGTGSSTLGFDAHLSAYPRCAPCCNSVLSFLATRLAKLF